VEKYLLAFFLEFCMTILCCPEYCVDRKYTWNNISYFVVKLGTWDILGALDLVHPGYMVVTSQFVPPGAYVAPFL